MARNGLLWPDLEPEAIEQGFLADVLPKVTAADVLTAIARRHPMNGWNGEPGRWVFCREVIEATGSYGAVQRFDAVAIGLVPSVAYARVVYEIKISRSDWLHELRPRYDRRWEYTGELDNQGFPKGQHVRVERPGRKYDAALAVSTEFWVAAPPRVVQLEELPPEAGLVEVRPWGPRRELRPRVIRQAPVRPTPNPGPEFWATILRRTAGWAAIATAEDTEAAADA